jgi:hypothetical protein
MEMRMFKTCITIFLLALLGLYVPACTVYESREVPFRPPAQYANLQTVAGVQLAAESYNDKGRAKEVFGFDIRGAGLLPVQVAIENSGDRRLEMVPEQTFLIDSGGNFWNLMDRRTAYQRVEESSEFSAIVKGGSQKAFWGAAAGALVGLAVGVLDGGNIGNDLGRGAVIGASGGAILGGAQAGTSGDQGRQIARDLANKQLDNRAIEPRTLGHGFLFFPGEAPDAAKLRLQLRDLESEEQYTVVLPL